MCLAGKQNSDRQFSDETLEKKRTVEVTRMHKCRAFGVGHHAEHIPARIANTCDIVQRSIWIGGIRCFTGRIAVAEHYLSVFFNLAQGVGIGVEATFSVCNRNGIGFVAAISARYSQIGVFRLQQDIAAHKLHACIAEKRTWEQTGFAENLKAVANAHYQATGGGMAAHGFHYRSLGCDGAAPQVITVRKTAGKKDHITAFQVFVLMPKDFNL